MICLLMLIKDEGILIERTLESCEYLIDSYFICDLGSDDNYTTDIIKRFMNKRKISGQIFKKPNISHFELVKEAEENYNSDYFLLLNSNEIIVNQKYKLVTQEDKKQLKLLFQQKCSQNYDVLLLNIIYGNSLKYRKRGPVFFKNNRLVTEDCNVNIANLDFVQLLHCSDVSNIDWHKRRAKLCSGYESYISLLNLFHHYKNKKYLKEATNYANRLKDEFPNRLEGLFDCMQYFYSSGDRKTAYEFGKVGMNALDMKDKLFIKPRIYTYDFLFNFSIVAYYSGHYQEALDASSMIHVKMPKDMEKQQQANIKFYKEKIKATTK